MPWGSAGTGDVPPPLLLVHSEPTANPSQGLLPPPEVYLPATATSAAARVSYVAGGMNGTNPVWRTITHYDPVLVQDPDLGHVYRETTVYPEGRVLETLRDKPSNLADAQIGTTGVTH